MNDDNTKYVIIGLNPGHGKKFRRKYFNEDMDFDRYIERRNSYFRRFRFDGDKVRLEIDEENMKYSPYYSKWFRLLGASQAFFQNNIVNTNLIPFHSRISDLKYRPNTMNVLSEYNIMMGMLLDGLRNRLKGIIAHGKFVANVLLRLHVFRIYNFEALADRNGIKEIAYGEYKDSTKVMCIPFYIAGGRTQMSEDFIEVLKRKIQQFLDNSENQK